MQTSTQTTMQKDMHKDKGADSLTTKAKEAQHKVIDDLSQSADELRGLWDAFARLQVHSQAWSKATLDLFLLELTNSAAVIKRLVFCQVLFAGLLLLFLFSASIGVGVVTYHVTQSVEISYGVFLLALAFILICLALFQKYILRFLGFRNTIDQLKEGFHVYTQQASKSNPDEAIRREK